MDLTPFNIFKFTLPYLMQSQSLHKTFSRFSAVDPAPAVPFELIATLICLSLQILNPSIPKSSEQEGGRQSK